MMPPGEQLWAEIRDAIAKIQDHQPPTHPQLIEGVLYVTPEQYDALLADVPVGYEPEAVKAGTQQIPVRRLHEREVVELPSGNYLAYSKVLGALVTFPPDTLPTYEGGQL